MGYILYLFAVCCLLNIPESVGQCSRIRTLLDDDSIRITSRSNDICILTGDSCCNKAVENQLLEKTKRILKNRVFLVLNQFYAKVDTDKNKKDALLKEIIINSTLSQSKKIALNEKFSSYVTGVNTLTSEDLEEIRSASAAGALEYSLGGSTLSATCLDKLYFDMETLRDAQLKYVGAILIMLRGYAIMTDLKIAATSQDLTEECYVGAVRGGLKFGGCNLCLDETASKQPCEKLCRNILSGCLKGHIQTREYLQHLTLYQIKLNSLVEQFSREAKTALDNLKSEVKSKLRVDKDFYSSCSNLKRGTEPAQQAAYSFDLAFDEDDARETLSSDWLCRYVFSGISEVNCWNRSKVGEYRLNIYEFTDEGQRQNPEVPGKGPVINIDSAIASYKDYKVKVEELDQGRVTINGALHSLAPSFLLTLLLLTYLTLT